VFGGISHYVIGAMLLIMLLMAGAGYWYWSWSQGRIEQLARENSQLHSAVSTQEAAITALRNNAATQAREVEGLQRNLADAESTRRAMEARLRRMNLQLMARNNSAELEASINRDTAQAFANLENITRSATATPAAGTTTSAPPAAPAASAASINNQPPPRPPVRGSTP
jgi:Tfp pilus assembly protein PilO